LSWSDRASAGLKLVKQRRLFLKSIKANQFVVAFLVVILVAKGDGDQLVTMEWSLLWRKIQQSLLVWQQKKALYKGSGHFD